MQTTQDAKMIDLRPELTVDLKVFYDYKITLISCLSSKIFKSFVSLKQTPRQIHDEALKP